MGPKWWSCHPQNLSYFSFHLGISLATEQFWACLRHFPTVWAQTDRAQCRDGVPSLPSTMEGLELTRTCVRNSCKSFFRHPEKLIFHWLFLLFHSRSASSLPWISNISLIKASKQLWCSVRPHFCPLVAMWAMAEAIWCHSHTFTQLSVQIPSQLCPNPELPGESTWWEQPWKSFNVSNLI